MKPSLDLDWLVHGSATPPPVRTSLQAGPLSLVFEAGDVRGVKLGGREILRRIYAAVRDPVWNTVAPEISNLRSEIGDLDFRIQYTHTHRCGEIHVVGEVVIAGDAEGGIDFSFDAETKSNFLSNRIGLCVLHPIHECAGAKCRVLHQDGSIADSRFPELVAIEQPIDGLHDLARLSHEVEPGLWAELRFEGEVFETEDQRNWIDASFKTYCPPLRLPRPIEVAAGTRFRQSVHLRLRRDSGSPVSAASPPARNETIVVSAGRGPGLRLPELGLGLPALATPESEREVTRLSRLGLAHLRTDLFLAGGGWPDSLRAAARYAVELGAALELIIHLPREAAGDLEAVARELRRLKVDLTRALILRDGQKSTLAADLDSACSALADCGMAIGAGTDGDLYQLHLQRPPDNADFLGWSMNPQVHATDLTSIAETPEAVGHQVSSVRSRYPGVPLVVSPVTLKPRFNTVASSQIPPFPVGELPPPVDPRQVSLFGAAWTLAMLKALAESGVESMTFYESTGWRGTMERGEGSPLTEKFPSIPGAVFPLYHVLADFGEFAAGKVIESTASRGSGVASLLLQNRTRQRLIVANLGLRAVSVALDGFKPDARARILDASNGADAMVCPERFRSRTAPFHGSQLELGPCAVATLDFADD